MLRWLALIAAIVLIAAVGIILSSQQSTVPAPQQSTENNHKEHAPQKNEIGLFDRWFPDSTAVFSLFLMIFTGVLAFGGLIQLNLLTRAERIAANAAKAANQSAEIAERALIAGQRAFVSVSFKQTANRELKTGNIVSWGFTPVWMNAGDTPTRLFENHINISIRDDELPADWDFPDIWKASVPAELRRPVNFGVPPKGSNDGQTLYVAVDGLDEVIAGKKFLYFWGWGAYNDVFPNTQRHVTRFAVRIIAGGNPRDKDRISFSYSILNRYNCSDEECDREGYPATWLPRIWEIQ